MIKERLNLELIVGVFMIIGLLCLGYLSIKLGKVEVLGRRGYEVYAIFSDVGGLRSGASVVVAGVDVGRVETIRLEDYEARVTLQVNPDLQISEDAIVSIKTSGLIGEKYVQISAGAAADVLKPGERIRQTEAVVDIEALISKYAFGNL